MRRPKQKAGLASLCRPPFLDHGYHKDVGRESFLQSFLSTTLIKPRDVGRTLSQGGYDDDGAMTDESSIAYCSEEGYIYAGTEVSLFPY
jgi:hypothetical protein